MCGTNNPLVRHNAHALLFLNRTPQPIPGFRKVPAVPVRFNHVSQWRAAEELNHSLRSLSVTGVFVNAGTAQASIRIAGSCVRAGGSRARARG